MSRIRVLVVDDELINGLLLELNLTDLGYQVVRAQDGVEAVDQVGKQVFDVVLMDVMMPKMGGIDATRNILDTQPDLPIIGITADDTASTRTMCLEAGMRAVLHKPVEIDQILSRIKDVPIRA